MTDHTTPEPGPPPGQTDAERFADRLHTLETIVNRVREAVGTDEPAPSAAGPATPAPTGQALALLRDAESYLSALHAAGARHDVLAANLGCAGCELRDRIAAALPTLAAAPTAGPATPTDTDQAEAPCQAAQLHIGHTPHTMGDTRLPVHCPGYTPAADEAPQPPADRAAVLAWAADFAEEVAEKLRAHHEFERSTGALDVMTELRRLADETATTQTPGPVLTDAERTMLTYALDQAQEHIWSEDGFTDEDQAAVDSLRRLTDVAAVQPAGGEQ